MKKYYTHTLIIFVLTMLFGLKTYSQGLSISLQSNTEPDASALLDIIATNKGLLLPRLSESERNAIPSPAAGLIIFNISSNKVNLYNGQYWRSIDDVYSSISHAGGLGVVSGMCISEIDEDPHHSAILEIKSTTRGLLLPRSVQNSMYIPSAAGLVFYNATTNKMGFFDGTNWQYVCESGTATAATGSLSVMGIAIDEAGSSDPHHSAMLEIKSTSKGLLLPRLNSSQIALIPSLSFLYSARYARIYNWCR